MFKKLSATLYMMTGLVAAFKSHQVGYGLCFQDSGGNSAGSFFNGLYGVSLYDHSLLIYCGIVSILCGIVICVVKNKYLVLVLAAILYVIEFILLNKMETAAFTDILIDSIIYCHNWPVLFWLVGQSVCLIFILINLKYLPEEN